MKLWKIFFTMGAISALCAYSFYWFFDDVFYFIMQDRYNLSNRPIPDGVVDYSTFFKFIAISFICYLLTIFFLVKEFIKSNWWVIFIFIVIQIACNALLDELFFDPTEIEVNEYIGTVAMIIITFYSRNKWFK